MLKRITDYYLKSRDFNGISLQDLGEDWEETRRTLRGLVVEGLVVLAFGDRHPNPHILAFEPESTSEQVEKLNNLVFTEPQYQDYGSLRIHTDSVSCCAYPSKSRLSSVVDPSEYEGRPYTLALAMGEPQLAYRAFNLRVLEFYRNDPRYSYQTDDIHGNISAREQAGIEPPDDAFLQTFGFAYSKDLKHRFVAVFVRYLADLTPEHQQRWKLDEAKAETFLHPEYARATAGEWPDKESVFNAFCEEIRIINEMTGTIWGNPLFRETYNRENKPVGLGFLIRPTKKEYDNFVQLLDKMMSDNLNKQFFKDKVPLVVQEQKGNITTERPKGTIVLLDEWLSGTVKFADPEPKDKMISAFKEVRNARGPLAHVERPDEWDDSYFVKQRELTVKAYEALRTLRLIFSNHPKAKAVEVPGWLYDGEIRTY
jgi:hypothetical protein